MTDTALLLRVHYWDEALAAFAASLRAHLNYARLAVKSAIRARVCAG